MFTPDHYPYMAERQNTGPLKLNALLEQKACHSLYSNPHLFRMHNSHLQILHFPKLGFYSTQTC
jgi:hypothetical protein